MDYENIKVAVADGILRLTIDRPKVLNALNAQTVGEIYRAFLEARNDDAVRAVIVTGGGEKAFVAGADINELAAQTPIGGKETAQRGQEVLQFIERFPKPVIAAINGFAMGGGFMLVERTDLRIAVPDAVFEVSEAKRWLLGGYNHGHIANLPYPIAMEMALGFRFTAERFYEIGFLNRLVEAEQLIPSALAMAEHLLTLPPASRVNTVHMMRQMRPAPSPEQQRLATALKDHGAKDDLIESRAAFAEKRPPRFKGWDDPEDRYRLPSLDGSRD